MCTACLDLHQRTNGSRSHCNVPIENLQARQVLEAVNKLEFCLQNHHGEQEPIKFFCQRCEVCICQKCSESNHHHHTTVTIAKAADEEKLQMRSVVNKLKPLIDFYQTRMSKQTELLERSKQENIATHKKVTEKVEGLICDLRDHEMSIKAKLNGIYETQQRDHKAQIENFQLLVSQLESFVKYGEDILERNRSAEILRVRSSYRKRGEGFTSLKNIELYNPQHVDYVFTMKDFIEGHVIVKHADSSKSVAGGKGLTGAEMDTETNFTVTINDEEGNQFYHEDDQMNVSVADPQGEFLEKEITDYKDGSYTVSYKPKNVGIHVVAIDVNGQALVGCPWKVEVAPYQYHSLFEFGSSGRQQGQFDWPVSIAVSKKTGNIAVADSDNKRIQLFKPDGSYLREFGHDGDENLNNPKSVAFTTSGFVTVLDSSKIFMFDESGSFINSMENKQLINPSSISVGQNDQLIVCDKGDKKIKILSPGGTTLLRSFCAPDCDTSPEFAIYHQNKIFVSYFEAHCIKVFSTGGHFAYNIGNKVTSIAPLGLATDKYDNLIICDFHNKRLQLFTLDGTFVSKIEQGIDEAAAPYAVAVSNDNHVFMIDILGHSIHVFQ